MKAAALEIKPGIASNETSYAEQQTFRTTDNVRFREGHAEVVGGWEAISATPVAGACRNIYAWRDNHGSPTIALGTHTSLYAWCSGELTEITPLGLAPGQIDGQDSGGYGIGAYGLGTYGEFDDSLNSFFCRTWSLSAFGQGLMANPRGGSIYYWRNDGTVKARAEVLAGSPQVVNYAMVTKDRSVLAFGCTDGTGVYNPRCIRGSDIDGNIEDWTPSNANNAFEEVIAGGGQIVAAREWGDLIAVWTQSGLLAATFVGSSSQTYRFDPVEGGVGLLGPNAACVVGQTLYWVSPDLHLWTCSLGSAPSLIPCPVLSDTLGQLTPAQGGKVVVSYIASADELRIDYPDQRDGFECSRYFGVCLADASWSRGTQARTAFDRGSPLAFPIAAGAMDANGNSTFYYHERGQSNDGAPLSWSFETNDFAIDENVTEAQLLGFWPDFKNQVGSIRMTILMRQYPQDPNEVSIGPYDLPAGIERVDLRCRGKIWRLRFEGSSYPAFARLGRPVLKFLPTSTR